TADSKERGYWDQYQTAYEDCFNHTSTEWAPWHIIPADNKWFTRTAVANIIVEKLKSLHLAYPVVDEAQQQELTAARTALMSE
ncbi:MAG: polyphosphate kinase 2 family protein, partial [Chloroflexi bacterium]|nr:polyphosphate kinase 2 family protein [Chloroflexota bacterium]